jgi:uncharacterized membrane protein AbrB (regulator of aidB expression)
MSLLETTALWLRAALLRLAFTVSRFEAETLHMPTLLRFFTEGAGEQELHLQAFMFAVAPLHASFTMPVLETLFDQRTFRSWTGYLLRYLYWYFYFLSMFWTVGFVVRSSYDT